MLSRAGGGAGRERAGAILWVPYGVELRCRSCVGGDVRDMSEGIRMPNWRLSIRAVLQAGS